MNSEVIDYFEDLLRKAIMFFPNMWLKIRLAYWVRWISRASVKEQRIYYVLLQPYTREIVVCNNNEYASIRRGLKLNNKAKISHYVYAIADPWRNRG